MKIIIVAGACLLLAACANADGSRPRLGPAASAGPGPASFNGGYAGMGGSFSNLGTNTSPF